MDLRTVFARAAALVLLGGMADARDRYEDEGVILIMTVHKMKCISCHREGGGHSSCVPVCHVIWRADGGGY